MGKKLLTDRKQRVTVGTLAWAIGHVINGSPRVKMAPNFWLGLPMGPTVGAPSVSHTIVSCLFWIKRYFLSFVSSLASQLNWLVAYRAGRRSDWDIATHVRRAESPRFSRAIAWGDRRRRARGPLPDTPWRIRDRHAHSVLLLTNSPSSVLLHHWIGSETEI